MEGRGRLPFVHRVLTHDALFCTGLARPLPRVRSRTPPLPLSCVCLETTVHFSPLSEMDISSSLVNTVGDTFIRFVSTSAWHRTSSRGTAPLVSSPTSSSYTHWHSTHQLWSGEGAKGCAEFAAIWVFNPGRILPVAAILMRAASLVCIWQIIPEESEDDSAPQGMEIYPSYSSFALCVGLHT